MLRPKAGPKTGRTAAVLPAIFLTGLIAVLPDFLPNFLAAPPIRAQEVDGQDGREENHGDLLRISNYLNGFRTLTGRFVQIAPDGGVSEGTFHLRRPGRMRFDYDPPDRKLIVADGVWIGVCDPQIETFERVPLAGTPLDLLLRDRVDLRREPAIRSVARADGQLRVTAVDPDAPDQGSIALIFDDAPLSLSQWIVVDNQGLTTIVALEETRTDADLGGALFRIDDENCAS